MKNFISVYRNAAGRDKVLRLYDQILSSLTVPAQEKYISTIAGDTFMIAAGSPDSPPLILVHALYATALSWYRNLVELSRHFRVYAVDMIGDPNKSRPVKPLRKDEDLIQWFQDLMAGLNVTEALYAGNSVGANHIVKFALACPGKVRKMSLVGPAATFQQIWPFYIHAFPAGFTGWDFMVSHAVWWLENGAPLDEKWKNVFYANMKYGRGIMQIFPKVFTDDELKQIKIPVQLILGSRENIYSIETVKERAAQLIPGIRIDMIDNANHFTAVSQPGPVNEVMISFLGN